MRVFLAGASGVIGRSAVRHLVSHGHQVFGTTRTPSKATHLEQLGADPVVVSLLDADDVARELQRTRPDVVVNMVTDLSTPPSFRTLDKSFKSTNALRTRGTEILLETGRRAGASRYVGQSFAGWFLSPEPGARLADEAVGFWTSPPQSARLTASALRHLEDRVVEAVGMSGTVLRFGPLYGPGTSMGAGGAVLADVSRGRIPIVGGGTGTWSFTHVEDAGRAVAAVVDHEGMTGVFHVVDDDPAPVSEWLPYLAEALDAPVPGTMPAWLARPAVGAFGVHVMTTARGVANAAIRTCGFQPTFPSWRRGFLEGLG
jgi:nucleoside-diphosphate-sugar epimerase